MFSSIALLVLLYDLNSVFSIPMICFVFAWISAGLALVRFVLTLYVKAYETCEKRRFR